MAWRTVGSVVAFWIERLHTRCMKRISSRSGFTLMELLVVVGVIGILVTIAFMSYIGIQQRARNSRRQTDLKSVQGAFEQYYGANNSTYPKGTVGTYACPDLTVEYLPAGMPKDPKYPNPEYTKSCDTTGAGYCICALKEPYLSSPAEAPHVVSDCIDPTSEYYCVKNLQ